MNRIVHGCICRIKMKKAVALLIVIGATLVVSALALAALSIMTQQSRLAENKIKRMRAFYAAQAAAVNVSATLKLGGTPPSSVSVGPSTGVPGYPINVTVTVGAAGGAYPLNESQAINTTVNY